MDDSIISDDFAALLKKVARAPDALPLKRFQGSARYDLIRELGAGGFGIVYEAYDRCTETSVALKTLRHMDPRSLSHLKNEFRALQDLAHPNLCSLGELAEEHGEWFFTMELVRGSDFISYVRPPGGEQGTFSAGRLRRALSQVAQGLEALHRAGKIHRDIKPTNVLVTPAGRVVLVDFGLATAVRGTWQQPGAETVGTAAYMAPEQAARREVGPAADCYAVGTMLFEALTGQLPFQGSAAEMLRAKQEHDAPRPSTLLGMGGHAPAVRSGAGEYASPARPPREDCGGMSPGALPEDLEALCSELLRINPRLRPSASVIGRRAQAVASMTPWRERSVHACAATAFVGRDRELQALRRAYLEVRGGAAITVMVQGESGIGKSALVRRFLAGIEPRDDAVVFEGRCYERESVPYKALDGVVDALTAYLERLTDTEAVELRPDDASLLPKVFPVLAQVGAIAMAPEAAHGACDLPEIRSRAFAALRQLFRRLSERCPLVVVIDDLHWADADSWPLLRELLRGPQPPRMLLLVTLRPLPQRADWQAGAYLPQDARRITLGPLPRERADDLVRSLAGPGACEPAGIPVADIVAEAAGHPLFIQELVRHASSPTADAGSGACAASCQHRARLDEAIWQRVTQLHDSARKVLELACLVAGPLSLSVLHRCARSDPERLIRDLAVLRQASLVCTTSLSHDPRVEPYHDRVRQSVLLHLNEATQVELHGQLAHILEQEQAPPEVLLRHWQLAGERNKAARYAREAAERAASALAFDRAAEIWQRAVDLSSHEPMQQRQLQYERAQALANAGRGGEAAQAFVAADPGTEDATGHIDCQRQAAEQWLVSGHIEEGLQAMELLLREYRSPMPRSPAGALLSLAWHRLLLRLRGFAYEPRKHRCLDGAALRRLNVYEAAARGLAMVDSIRAADYQARGLVLALKTGERSRIGRALVFAGPFFAASGARGCRRARACLAEARRIATAEGSPYLQGLIASVDGFLTLYEGRLRAASEVLSRAEVSLRDETAGTAWELSTTRILRLLALRMQGRLSDVRDLQERTLLDARRRGDLYTETTVRRLCVRLHLAADEPAAAHQVLGDHPWVSTRHGVHLQHFLEVEARVDTALYEGTLAAAACDLLPPLQRLRRSIWGRVQMVRAEIRSLWGRMWLAQGQDPALRRRALREVHRSVRQLQNERLGYIDALAFILQAGAAEHASAAMAALRRCCEAAHAANMDHLVAAAQYRLGELMNNADGSSLMGRAESSLRAEGVVNISRFVGMLAPGFYGLRARASAAEMGRSGANPAAQIADLFLDGP